MSGMQARPGGGCGNAQHADLGGGHTWVDILRNH